MVVALIALGVALGGTSYAAVETVPNNSVGTAQLKNLAVTGPKLAARAVTGSKVANRSLTGKQINAATLGTVPNAKRASAAVSATFATSAATAANGARRVDFQGQAVDSPPANPPTSEGTHVVLRLRELTISASCINTGSGTARLYATFTSSVPAHLSWSAVRFDNPGTEPVLDGLMFGPGVNLGPTFSAIDLAGNNKFETGEWIYRNATREITVALHAGAKEFTAACDLEGTATAAPG